MEYSYRQCRRGNPMSTNKFWSAILMVCATLLMGGLLSAGRMLQAQYQQPPPDDRRQPVLESLRRLINSAQTPQSNPAVDQGAPASPSTPPSQRVSIYFEDSDLSYFITEVSISLGITPIFIDPDVRGTVRVETLSPMEKDDVFSIFLIVLKNNNAVIVKGQGIYQIIPISSNSRAWKKVEFIDKLPEPSTLKSEPKQSSANNGNQRQPESPLTSASAKDLTDSSNQPPRLATHIVQVKSVPVKDLIEQLKPLITGGVITPYERMNMLIFTDYPETAAKILKIIHSRDSNPKAKDSHIE
jgi:type II secretory pathway component GspD/PulD (secretin)